MEGREILHVICSRYGRIHRMAARGPLTVMVPVEWPNADIATSVQKGCKCENSNLRKTIFIVQRNNRNTINIFLQTGYG